MDNRIAVEETKFDRWLLPIVLVLAVWGMAFGTWLEVVTNIEASFAYFFGSGLFGIWLVRLADPKVPRQLFIVVAVGIGVISLTFLGCAGVFLLADSVPIRELGYVATMFVRGLGVGLCFMSGIGGSKWIYPRFGVPLRDMVSKPN